MAKYDIELFLSDLETMMKSKLNDKIDAINTEKGDTLINNINDNAWYFSQLPTNWSYKQFIIWGLQNIELNAQQNDAHIQTVSVFFEVAIPDGNENKTEAQIYKLLRYTRCLQEIVTENFDSIRHYGKLQVQSLPPTLISVGDKSLKSSGVNITASFDI